MSRIIYRPESVRVEDTGSEHCERLILFFDDGVEARFHISIDENLSLGDTLYKNSIVDRFVEGSSYLRNEGFFETRHLSPTAKENAALLAELIEIVRRDDLIAKARATKAEERRIAEERSNARRRLYHVRELGPQLLDAIRDAVEAFERFEEDDVLPPPQADALAELRNLVELADAPFEALRKFEVRPKAKPQAAASTRYAVNERAAIEDYVASTNGSHHDLLPEDVEAVELPRD